MAVIQHLWMQTIIKVNRRRRCKLGCTYTPKTLLVIFRNVVGEERFLSGALVIYLTFNTFVRQVMFVVISLDQKHAFHTLKITLKEHLSSWDIRFKYIIIISRALRLALSLHVNASFIRRTFYMFVSTTSLVSLTTQPCLFSLKCHLLLRWEIGGTDFPVYQLLLPFVHDLMQEMFLQRFRERLHVWKGLNIYCCWTEGTESFS